MREFTCSWCDALPGHPCRTGHGRVIAAAHSYRRIAAINAGRLPIQDGTFGGDVPSVQSDEDDEYLAIVERQRGQALVAIERVRALHVSKDNDRDVEWCAHDMHGWPCPTIRALGTLNDA